MVKVRNYRSSLVIYKKEKKNMYKSLSFFLPIIFKFLLFSQICRTYYFCRFFFFFKSNSAQAVVWILGFNGLCNLSTVLFVLYDLSVLGIRLSIRFRLMSILFSVLSVLKFNIHSIILKFRFGISLVLDLSVHNLVSIWLFCFKYFRIFWFFLDIFWLFSSIFIILFIYSCLFNYLL